MDIHPINEWLPQLSKPVVISGPCSAESRNQVLETCQHISESGRVSILRAGIWKPRTRPNSFEGVGEIGLVPTAGAVAGAIAMYDGRRRYVLPMKDSPAAQAVSVGRIRAKTDAEWH